MENKLRCAVVDDEQNDIKPLKKLIIDHPHLSLVATYTDPLRALASISSRRDIDLLFLDIDMPVINGITLAEQIRDRITFLVFTTAHADYALKGYSVNADNFLVKPITPFNFLTAINNLREINNSVTQASDSKRIDDGLYFRVENKSKTVRVARNEVRSIEPLKGLNYMKVTLFEEEHVFGSSLNHLEEFLLDDKRFMRVNRSSIINLTRIKGVEGNRITLDNGHEVPIGVGYRETLMEYITEKLGSHSADRI
ncbi:LytTR family DNA-binding domain-containing protein [Pedobacter psychrodurus]|uniref:LytR/AlgR family response regulator transcription factor n=1 Tax=Pedobacter psychrodurus TaxID=2530456 RepID=UPI0029306D71|nr:LytTR family DNA-binding domain-containing protein [Pedobacter psychrodurus]